MRRETILGGIVVAVVAATLLLVVAVPGAIATPERPTDPARVGVNDVLLSVGPVSGGTATLSVDLRLEHRGGPAENVTVELRAVDAESGTVAATTRRSLGTVDADGERGVRANLSVPREGGYRIEAAVYVGNDRVGGARRSVQGVGSLTPAYADVPVEFRRFRGFGTDAGGLPTVEYAIAGVEDRPDPERDRVTFRVRTYLTNGGDRTVEGLELRVKARQSGSKVVADEARIDLGAIAAGRTATPTVTLTVPDGYNYYLDAYLWRDGVVLDTTRSAANLRPNESLSVSQENEGEGFRVGDFEGDGGDAGEAPTDGRRETTTTVSAGQPGFGLPVAVLAVLALALGAARARTHAGDGGEGDE